MLGAGGEHLPDELLHPRRVNRPPQQPSHAVSALASSYPSVNFCGQTVPRNEVSSGSSSANH
jgi:hypothetical protein